MAKVNNILIMQVGVHKWTIPMYGNKHTMPYGTLYVEIAYKEHPFECMKTEFLYASTKGDMEGDKEGYQYVTIKRWRYKVVQVGGTMYKPKFQLRPMKKEKVNGKLCWVD